MRISHSVIAGAVVVIGLALFLLFKVLFPEAVTYITATVETGSVRELVSVSGFVEAKQAAKLTFPSSGIVTAVLVEEGSTVIAGEVLATLASAELVADRAAALSSLEAAKANYAKLVAGPRGETITLANTTLATAKENLTRTTAEENQKVENARAALLSTGLTAETTNENESSPAPTVSGTYLCDTEGIYTIEVYSSGSRSGMSFRVSGLENTTGVVSSDQPAPLGDCGLYLLFTEDESYSGSTWTIEVPNQRSSSYTTLKNAYDLALTQAQNAIASSRDALLVAEKETGLSTAGARSEDVRESSARVQEAQARISAIDARLADRSIVAPFAGTVTTVDIIAGESTPLTSVITVLADNTFTLKARIPEIDITKLALDQKIEAVFDAASHETVTGTISYISPIATQIDGVAYFEITIELETTPSWLRAGLNADIDIITKEKTEVLRLPKRFVITGSETPAVLIQTPTGPATTTIKTIFTGNDGFIAIEGLAAGTTVIAP